MSLKAVHLVFVTALSALAFGFAVWMFRSYSLPEGQTRDLIYGIGSVLAGVGVIYYGVRFLKKLKNVSYL